MSHSDLVDPIYMGIDGRERTLMGARVAYRTTFLGPEIRSVEQSRVYNALIAMESAHASPIPLSETLTNQEIFDRALVAFNQAIRVVDSSG